MEDSDDTYSEHNCWNREVNKSKHAESAGMQCNEQYFSTPFNVEPTPHHTTHTPYEKLSRELVGRQIALQRSISCHRQWRAYPCISLE